MSKARGFALMTPEQRREISSKGGQAAHALGRAHKWTVDEARVAGHKGGVAVHAPKRLCGRCNVATSHCACSEGPLLEKTA